jgi:hypothetical protein
MIKNISKYIYILPLFLAGIFFILKSLKFPIHDYGNYYYGAKLMLEQNFDLQVYFPEWFNIKIAEISHQYHYLNYTPNTPFLALFYIPFSILDIAFSKLIFNVVSFFLFGVSIHRLFKFLKIEIQYIAILPIVFLIPIKNNILFGQTYFFLLFLLIESYLLLEKKKQYKAGFLISLSICLKVFPVFLIPYLLLKKEWKVVFSILFFSALFFGISFLFISLETWYFYLFTVLKKASNGEISGEIVSNYQSIQMFLKSELTNYKSYLIGIKTALLGFTLFFTLKSKNNLYNFAAWLLLSITFSGYGSTYSLLILIWIYASICKSEVELKWKIVWFFLLFMICNIPIHYLNRFVFPLNYFRLLIMIILGSSLIFYFRRKLPVFNILLISCCCFLSHFFYFPKVENNIKKAIPNENELLITDFQLKDNKLIYNYWTENGLMTKSLLYKIRSSKPLKIIENQIWINGKKITTENSNKKKAILVDNTYLLYLTDYDRGVGFYDLKKLTLQ